MIGVLALTMRAKTSIATMLRPLPAVTKAVGTTTHLRREKLKGLRHRARSLWLKQPQARLTEASHLMFASMMRAAPPLRPGGAKWQIGSDRRSRTGVWQGTSGSIAGRDVAATLSAPSAACRLAGMGAAAAPMTMTVTDRRQPVGLGIGGSRSFLPPRPFVASLRSVTPLYKVRAKLISY
jgi:hypothetical protein